MKCPECKKKLVYVGLDRVVCDDCEKAFIRDHKKLTETPYLK